MNNAIKLTTLLLIGLFIIGSPIPVFPGNLEIENELTDFYNKNLKGVNLSENIVFPKTDEYKLAMSGLFITIGKDLALFITFGKSEAAIKIVEAPLDAAGYAVGAAEVASSDNKKVALVKVGVGELMDKVPVARTVYAIVEADKASITEEKRIRDAISKNQTLQRFNTETVSQIARITRLINGVTDQADRKAYRQMFSELLYKHAQIITYKAMVESGYKNDLSLKLDYDIQIAINPANTGVTAQIGSRNMLYDINNANISDLTYQFIWGNITYDKFTVRLRSLIEGRLNNLDKYRLDSVEKKVMNGPTIASIKRAHDLYNKYDEPKLSSPDVMRYAQLKTIVPKSVKSVDLFLDPASTTLNSKILPKSTYSQGTDTSVIPKLSIPSLQATTKSIIFILDTSASMNQPIPAEGMSKLEAAKKALVKTIAHVKNEGKANEYALITYNGCVPVLTSHFISDPGVIVNRISHLGAGGSTPIAQSIAMAVDLMNNSSKGDYGQIILLSDGQETCNGNPVEAASKINNQKQSPAGKYDDDLESSLKDLFIGRAYAQTPTFKQKKITLSVIGFTIGHGSQEEKALQELAAAAGGTYYTAGNLPELQEALKQSADEIFDISRYLADKRGKVTSSPKEAPVFTSATSLGKEGASPLKKVFIAITVMNLLLIGAVIFLYMKKRSGYSKHKKRNNGAISNVRKPKR
jgi:Mg-chelatase subunit ChlD